jgi:hypothetical protein
MSNYETSTTVGGDGEIHLAGLPFRPGTEVQIVVSPKPIAGADGDRVAGLMAALHRAHNTQTVGTLRRDELYDRNGLD